MSENAEKHDNLAEERYFILHTFALILLCIGVHQSFAQCDASLFAGGIGTEADPYQISTAQQLQNLRQCGGKGNYVLTGDIDLTAYLASDGPGYGNGMGWWPIDLEGKFNGNGHKVSGLWINMPSSSRVGLFGSGGGEIKNLGVEIDDSNGGVRGKDYVGGLVGYGGTITNSYATGSITGKDVVGGLAGQSTDISNSYATGNVTGKDNVGGLVGQTNGTISNSYATGNVSSNNSGGCTCGVGGLVGSSSGTITNSYATGSVTGTGDRVGGLVGLGNTISNSYATGSVSGNHEVGGLVGNNSGTISNSYATGSVSGNENVGGLVRPGISVTGNNVGGLVGQNGSGIITNSYATGNVSGNENVGGLVGYNYGNNNYSSTITNSYATGSVTGTGDHVGGLVGAGSNITINNSYYDKETTGRTDTGKGIGKTTAEMKTKSTYEGWDFGEAWIIVNNPNYANTLNNGYPILRWQLSNNPTVSSIPTQTYTGSAIEPALTVTLNNITLTKGTDYTVSYSNNTNVGTTKITITGIGSYNNLEPIEAYFTITQEPVTIGITANFSNLIVKAIPSGISIENLPANAKVEIFNLQGKRIYSAYPENRGSDKRNVYCKNRHPNNKGNG